MENIQGTQGNSQDPRWPIYYSDTIHIGNLDSETAILCLWTKKERVIEKLNPNNYAFIGQLYSKEYGLQILARNLLANPHIRNLIVVGIDLNDSSTGLLNLFSKGIDDENRIIDTDIFLDDQITNEHIDLLKKQVKIHDLRKIKDFSKLNKYLEKIKKLNSDSQRIIIPLPKVRPPTRFPTDFSGFKARGRDFYSAYRELISFILRYGVYDPEKKALEVANILLYVDKFSEHDKKYLESRKTNRIKKKQILDFQYNDKKVCTVMFEKLELWDELKDYAKKYDDYQNICMMISKAYILERDLEDAVEMAGVQDKSIKWDPDPNGNLVIRVEDGLIKVIHVSQKGNVLDEFSANTARELFRKIANESRISIFYHALDIGAELQKAEIALKEGKQYVQDKKN